MHVIMEYFQLNHEADSVSYLRRSLLCGVEWIKKYEHIGGVSALSLVVFLLGLV